MTNDQQAAEAKEPTVVRTGARRPCPRPPSPGDRMGCRRRDVELERPSALCLAFEPRKSGWPLTIVVILGLSAGPIVGVVFTLQPGFERNAPWGLRVLSVILAAVFVVSLLFGLLAMGSWRRRLRFDRAGGLFTVGRRPFWLIWRPLKLVSSRPLADLVGVQVIDCGRQGYSLEVGEPGTPGSVVSGISHGYQLNLILNDTSAPRLNIAPFGWAVDARRRPPTCRFSECAVLRSAGAGFLMLQFGNARSRRSSSTTTTGARSTRPRMADHGRVMRCISFTAQPGRTWKCRAVACVYPHLVFSLHHTDL